MKKRIMSILLSLCILLGMIPTAARAAGGKTETIVCEGAGSLESTASFSALPSPAGLDESQTVYTGSYYNQLDSDSKKVYDAILSDSSLLANGPTTEPVSVSGVVCGSQEAVSAAVSAAIGALLYDHPELSWLVNTPYSISYTVLSGSYTLVSVAMTEEGYIYATQDWTDETYGYLCANTGDKDAMDCIVDSVASEIGSLTGQSDYEKVRAIYDWMCSNIQYADTSSEKYIHNWRGYQTAYTALVLRETVCTGYAKAFKLLCDAYGISCAIITGTSHGENHAWNYVLLDDSWYGVDVTWGDQGSFISYDYLLKGAESFSEHENGTLYSEYAFVYPTLSDADYAAPDAPATFALSYSPEAAGFAAADDGTQIPAFSVPGIQTLGVKETRTIAFAAVFPEEEPADRTVDWSLNGCFDGITLEDHQDGTASLHIASSALADYDDNSGPVITVTAYCSTAAVRQSLLVYVAARKPTFLNILREDASISSDDIEVGSSASYSALVYDQYGKVMTGQDITWSVSGDGTASVDENGNVTVSPDSESGCQFTLTATSGGASAETVITIHHFSETWSSNGSYHWRTCQDQGCSAITDYAAHTLVDGEIIQEPTCTDYGKQQLICEVCGMTDEDMVELIPSLGHSWNDAWETNSTHHWHSCAHDGCSLTDSKAAHTYGEGEITMAASCSEAGELTYTCMVCGAAKTEAIPATGAHTWDQGKITKDATCIATGELTYTCTECGATKTEELSLSSEHTWDDGEITAAATCVSAGAMTCTCSLCGAVKTETIPMLPHSCAEEWLHDDAAHWQKCLVCGAITNYAAHTLVDGEIIQEPTCTDEGLKQLVCEVCGTADENIMTVPSLGHIWSDQWTYNASTHWHVCTREGCSFRYQEEEHTWDAGIVTREATREEAGEIIYTCTVCSTEKAEELPALTHTYSSEWAFDEYAHWHPCLDDGCTSFADYGDHIWEEVEVLQQPTCVDPGLMRVVCTECGASGEAVTEAVLPLGHIWSDKWNYNALAHWYACTREGCSSHDQQKEHTWSESTVTKEATCTAAGEWTYTCTVCGFERTEEIPATGHTWGDWTVIQEAACESEGTEARTCTVCGENEIRALDALGHNFANGVYDFDTAVHWLICSRCGAADEKAAHSLDEGKITKEASCAEPGVKTYTCECGYEKVEEIPATGHTWSDWTVTEIAKCESEGTEARTCTVCGETESRSTEALGHDFATGEWSSDEENHWHTCSRCGAVGEKADHSFDEGTITKKANCAEPGVKTYTCTVCGFERTEEIPATGHTWGDWTVIQEAACESEGIETRTCAVCGEAESLTRDALGHDFANGVYDFDTAVHWLICSRCGAADEKAAHSFDEGNITKEASCAEPGVKTYTCECGYTITEDIPATGHTWSDWTVIQEAACESEGTEARTCTVCGETESRSTEALGHDFTTGEWNSDEENHWHTCSCCGAAEEKAAHSFDEGKITKEASCAEPGVKTYTCTVCSYEQTEVIPATGHTWSDWTVTETAKCESEGTESRTCTVCGETESRSTEALGHDFTTGEWNSDEENHWHTCSRCGTAGEKAAHSFDEGKITKGASCAEPGVKTYTCECGYTITEDIPATGHTWSDWTVTETAKCESEGTESRTCTVCGEAESQTTEALGHAFTTGEWNSDEENHWHTCSRCGAAGEKADHSFDEGNITKEASCSEPGMIIYTCTVCGFERTEEIPATGHTWSDWTVTQEAACESEGTETRTCAICGEAEYRTKEALGHDFATGEWSSDEENHWHTCSRCGAADEKAAHSLDEGKITKEASCSEPGAKTYTCGCGYTIIEDIPATGHAWSDWTVIQEATCESEGTETRTCTVCGEAESLTRDALGHDFATGEWNSDEENHWHTCSRCGAAGEKAAHSFDEGKITKDASCSEPGVKTYTCECGYEKAEEIPAIGYHTWNAGVVTTPATDTGNGIKTYTCTICGETRTEVYAKESIPVTAGTESLKLTVDAGQTATEVIATDEDIEKLISYSSDTGGAVSLDLSTAAAADTLVLPQKLVTAISESDSTQSLTVTTGAATVSFSSEALERIGKSDGTVDSSDNKVILSLSTVAQNKLPETQQAALEELNCDGAVIVDISLCVIDSENNTVTAVHELGGAVTISVPYTLEPGMDGNNVKAVYISDDGTATVLPAQYSDGMITFTVDHFSTFAVYHETQQSGETSEPSVPAISDSPSGPSVPSVTTDPSQEPTSEAGSILLPGVLEGGAVWTDAQTAQAGETVNIGLSLNAGYALDTLMVIDDGGNNVDLIQNADGTCSFRMPEGDVRIQAIFQKIAVPAANPFRDVAEDAYYCDAVMWALSAGVTTGMTADSFAPEISCTRAQAVTFLWRAVGCPEAGDSLPFTDVPDNAYYAEAVRWAVRQGVTLGTGGTTFSPNEACTRSQIVTFLWRAVGCPEAGDSLPFTDVPDNAYYAEAVRWAVRQGVTQGTSKTSFSPNAVCTRAQITAFLYRTRAGA